MTHLYEPFTPDMFRQQTGLNAADNEAIYLRWVNTNLNYATYRSMQEMTESLRQIIVLLRESAMPGVSR